MSTHDQPTTTESRVGTRLDVEIARLRECHSSWAARHLNGGITYALPRKAIESRALVQFFDDQDLQAELAFAGTCESMATLGIRGRDFISHPLCGPHLMRLDAEWLRRLGWSRAPQNDKQLRAGLDSANERRLGVAGRLLTEPLFMSQVEELRAVWERLPDDGRPGFPLTRPRPLIHPTTTDVRPADSEIAAFVGRLIEFLDQWGLISLVDWHLPNPQGPLLPALLPPGAPAEPRHGVRIVLPALYPLQGDDQLMRQIAQMQRWEAIDAGLPPELGPVRHVEQHAQMFRLIHLEQTIRGRFEGRPPVGLAGAIEAAAAEVLGVGLDTSKRLRKWVSACRRGHRDRIHRLRET